MKTRFSELVAANQMTGAWGFRQAMKSQLFHLQLDNAQLNVTNLLSLLNLYLHIPDVELRRGWS